MKNGIISPVKLTALNIDYPITSVVRSLWVLWLLLFAWTNSYSQELTYTNKAYKKTIHTIMLQQTTMLGRNLRTSSIIALHEQPGLTLAFDDLQEDAEDYYVKIIPCDYDWTPSTISTLDFMDFYNEFRIDNYTFSNSSISSYVHYQFDVPSVKFPGNYLLVVYLDDDQSTSILSRRFMVFQNDVIVEHPNSRQPMPMKSTQQQLNFTIYYKKLGDIDALETLHVTLRQNKNWTSLTSAIQPITIYDDKLAYQLPNHHEAFIAGNEYRFVDFRSLDSPGQHTAYLNHQIDPPHLFVQQDDSKANQVYAQYPDRNGDFYIQNLDYNESDITAAYVHVTFTLQTADIIVGDVYTVGRFNDWMTESENNMHYNTDLQAYQCTLWLKQGWYDYQYLVKSTDVPSYHFEGSHFETENEYEIFIYHRPFGSHTDQLKGYSSFHVNER